MDIISIFASCIVEFGRDIFLEVNVAISFILNGQRKLSSWKSGLVLTTALIRSMSSFSIVHLTVRGLTSAFKNDAVNISVVWYSTPSIVSLQLSTMEN
jgi:hypothetical protein